MGIIKILLLFLLRLLSYLKTKIDALIYWIILLTEKAIVVVENTPEYAYRLFLFTGKLIDLLTKVIVFIFKMAAIPVGIVLSLLLIVFRFCERQFDRLIYGIILLTEKAIVVAENTPEYAYRLFLFTEKLIDLLTKVIVFIFKMVAIPTGIVLSLLLAVFRFCQRQFDRLIYGIILLTEKAIFVVENTPAHTKNFFVTANKKIRSRTTVFVLKRKLNLIRFQNNVKRYDLPGKNKQFALLLYKLVTSIKNGVVHTVISIFKIIGFINNQFVLLVRSITVLIYKIIIAIKNGLLYIAVTTFKATVFVKNLFVSLIRSIAALTYLIFLSIKSGTINTKNFLVADKNLFLARTTIFALKRKRRLIRLRDKAKDSTVLNRPKQYALLIRLNKPIGILLLLWPTLIALWIAAEGWPDQDVLLVFVAGVFLMRSAGCAINDYADRNIDGHVARTKDRPLPSGKITSKEALIIFSILSITAFFLVLLMNPLTIVMSAVGLVLAASYPFMKRHTYLPQVHLGAAFGWAVPMAYAAQANELVTVTWLLFIATLLWTTAYDTMYAMVDRDDDLKIGVKSTAILFESADTLIIGIIQTLLILCLIMIGQRLELGLFYFGGILIATGFAVWQQRLIRDREPAQCFKAFLNNNWLGLALFVGVFLEYQIGDITL